MMNAPTVSTNDVIDAICANEVILPDAQAIVGLVAPDASIGTLFFSMPTRRQSLTRAIPASL